MQNVHSGPFVQRCCICPNIQAGLDSCVCVQKKCKKFQKKVQNADSGPLVQRCWQYIVFKYSGRLKFTGVCPRKNANKFQKNAKRRLWLIDAALLKIHRALFKRCKVLSQEMECFVFAMNPEMHSRVRVCGMTHSFVWLARIICQNHMLRHMILAYASQEYILSYNLGILQFPPRMPPSGSPPNSETQIFRYTSKLTQHLTPEIHQIEKLGFLGISRYKFKLRCWVNLEVLNRTQHQICRYTSKWTQHLNLNLYSPFRGRWDSKWSSECKTKS